MLGCDCLVPVLCCAVLCCAALRCAVLCCAVLCWAVLCCALSSYARLCCNALSTSTRAACLQDLPPNLLPFLRLGNCSSNEGLRQHGAFLQTSDPLPPAEEAQVLQNLASCIQQRLQRLVLASTCAALAPAAALLIVTALKLSCLYCQCLGSSRLWVNFWIPMMQDCVGYMRFCLQVQNQQGRR